MDRSNVFTVALVALIIFLAVTLAALIVTAQQESPVQGWSFQASDSSYYSNMYVCSDDTLYTVDGTTI